MRHLRNVFALSISMLILSGCGQSGALYLPQDANQNKRAHYLLYSSDQEQAKAQTQTQEQAKASQTPVDAAVQTQQTQQQFDAPASAVHSATE